MRFVALILLLSTVAACTTAPPPAPLVSPAPDDPRAPPADTPYRPVMAGTAYHGVGSKP